MKFKKFFTCFSLPSYLTGQGFNMVFTPATSFPFMHLGTEETTTG